MWFLGFYQVYIVSCCKFKKCTWWFALNLHIYIIFSLRTAPRTAHTLISGKNSFRAMILGRFSLLQSPYVDFQKPLFPRNDFEPFQHTPELSFQIPISAPRTDHTLIFKKNCSRAMLLSRFSMLLPRNDFGRFQFTPELSLQVPILASKGVEYFHLGQLPDVPRPWFRGKVGFAQWFWVVSVYSRA